MGGEVKDPFGDAARRPAAFPNRVAIADVRRRPSSASPRTPSRGASRPLPGSHHRRHPPVAVGEQPAGQVCADEAGGAGDEVLARGGGGLARQPLVVERVEVLAGAGGISSPARRPSALGRGEVRSGRRPADPSPTGRRPPAPRHSSSVSPATGVRPRAPPSGRPASAPPGRVAHHVLRAHDVQPDRPGARTRSAKYWFIVHSHVGRQRQRHGRFFVSAYADQGLRTTWRSALRQLLQDRPVSTTMIGL